MPTTYIDLPGHLPAYVYRGDQRIHGTEVEVACNAERTLVEVKQAVVGGGVLLARTIHETMASVTMRGSTSSPTDREKTEPRNERATPRRVTG